MYEGTLNGRRVAVKRMLVHHNALAMREVEFLQKVDLHPNLITYYHHEQDKDFVFLALEKCEGNLEHFIDLKKMIKKEPNIVDWSFMPLGDLYMKHP